MTESILLPGGRLLTYRQLADLLQCSERTVYNFVQRGAIVPFRCGGLVRFTEETVEEFVKRNSKAENKPVDLQFDPEAN